MINNESHYLKLPKTLILRHFRACRNILTPIEKFVVALPKKVGVYEIMIIVQFAHISDTYRDIASANTSYGLI